MLYREVKCMRKSLKEIDYLINTRKRSVQSFWGCSHLKYTGLAICKSGCWEALYS